MCKIKRRVYLLANYFADTVKETTPEIHKWLVETLNIIDGYSRRDDALIRATKAYNGKYTYTALKKIKDTTPKSLSGFTKQCKKKIFN